MPLNGEGWDGKSIRDHVESAKNEAAYAVEIAENCADSVNECNGEIAAISEEVETLKEEVAALRAEMAARPKLSLVPKHE